MILLIAKGDAIDQDPMSCGQVTTMDWFSSNNWFSDFEGLAQINDSCDTAVKAKAPGVFPGYNAVIPYY